MQATHASVCWLHSMVERNAVSYGRASISHPHSCRASPDGSLASHLFPVIFPWIIHYYADCIFLIILIFAT